MPISLGKGKVISLKWESSQWNGGVWARLQGGAGGMRLGRVTPAGRREVLAAKGNRGQRRLLLLFCFVNEKYW